MDIISSLKWRAAVRQYDTNKKVSSDNLEALLEAGNLAATSMGLQPFKIIAISNQDIKKQMVPMSYNQQQVFESSHLLVFAIETDINEDTVQRYFNRIMKIRGLKSEDLENYKSSVTGYLSEMDSETKKVWATKQAYIALGTVMSAAATLKIDSCAMEGFLADEYTKLLNLDSKDLMPVVALTIGYRSELEQMASLPKVRKTRDEFVLEINK